MAPPGARALLLALLVGLAGCSGSLVTAEASPATVSEPALQEHGYVLENTTEVPLTYRLGGMVPVVSASTWATGYSRPTAMNRTALLVLYSAPNRKVAGQSMNPLVQLSNRELIGFVLERVVDAQTVGGLAAVSDLQVRGSRNLTVLGEPVELGIYSGTAVLAGQRVDIIVNVAVVEHGGDAVVALGVHDATLDETAVHADLIEAIEHAEA